MTRRARATLAAVLLVGAALVAGCTDDGDDEGGGPAPGRVEEGQGEVPGRHVFVQTPEGRIDFSVAAPDDGVVGISWEWDFRTAFAAMAPATVVEPHVRLVADGRDYSLDDVVLRADRRADEPALEFSGTAYVGVSGDPDELAIAVEYDGVDQVVTVGDSAVVREGPAASLYQQPDELAQHVVDCGPPAAAGRGPLPDTNGQCRLTVARVPYVAGSGWVEGRDDRWLAVDARVWPSRFPQIGDRSCGEGELGPVQYRLAGVAPVRETRADPDSAIDPDRLVFATDRSGPDELRMSAVQTFPGEPACPALTLTWTARV